MMQNEPFAEDSQSENISESEKNFQLAVMCKILKSHGKRPYHDIRSAERALKKVFRAKKYTNEQI